MTTPIPVLSYQKTRNRRDHFGIASLPFAVLYVADLFYLRGITSPWVFGNAWFSGMLWVLSGCFLLGLSLAITGIVLMRIKSIAGWTTLAICAATIIARLTGLL